MIVLLLCRDEAVPRQGLNYSLYNPFRWSERNTHHKNLEVKKQSEDKKVFSYSLFFLTQSPIFF